MIRVEHVTKRYFGEHVLDDVTLHIKRGRMLGLIGPGGAGKSLLLKVMSGLVKPDSGQVFVDDVEISRLSETELAKVRFKIGMLFQNYALFDFMTVAGNIGFPLRQRGDVAEELIEQRVDDLLGQVGLPHARDLYPNELSGGMKKRVTFARAVITDPPILFYDDPTAGLDPVTSSKIFILLRERQETQEVTSVSVSHDVDGMKPIIDEWAMLNRGRLLFHGSRQEIERCDIKLVRQFWEGTSDD